MLRFFSPLPAGGLGLTMSLEGGLWELEESLPAVRCALQLGVARLQLRVAGFHLFDVCLQLEQARLQHFDTGLKPSAIRARGWRCIAHADAAYTSPEGKSSRSSENP